MQHHSATAPHARTSRLVRLLRSLGGVCKVPGRVPRQQQPDAVRLEYFKALRPHLERMRAAFAAVQPAILRLLADLRAEQGHLDAGGHRGAAAQALVDRAAREASRTLDPSALRVVAAKFGRRATDFQRGQLDRQLRSAIGVSIDQIERPTVDRIPEFAARNVDLIKTVPERYFDRIRADVEEAFAGGTHPSTLADDLAEKYDIAEDDARRIARDQIGKLNAEVNQDRQEALGVTGYTWRTVNDQRVRDNHSELDGEHFEWDDPPMGGGTSDDEEGHPGSGIQCVPGDVRVSLHAVATKAYRYWYSGQLTEIVAGACEPLRCTPQHPVLTTRGWLAAHLVEVGDYLVEAPAQALHVGVEHPQGGDSSAEELFRALEAVGILHRVAVATGFHGDVTDEEVDAIDVDRGLFLDMVATRAERLTEHRLAFAAQAAATSGDCAFPFVSTRAATGFMSSRGESEPSRAIGEAHAHVHSLRSVPRFDAVAEKRLAYWRSFTPELVGDRQLAMAAEVGANDLRFRQVKSTMQVPWAGTVYNFETDTGWFSAHGLIIHNCRCYAEPDLGDILAAGAEE